MDEAGQILLTDDDDLVRAALAPALAGAGFRVDVAASGQEALERLARVRYDVLVSDIFLPDIQGMDLLRRLPARNAGLPVVVITGQPSMATALEAMGRSVLAYLLKPVDAEELAGHLRRGVRMRRLQDFAQDSSRRLQAWADEMKAFEAEARVSPAFLGPLSVGSLAGVVLGNLAASALDLKKLMDLASAEDPSGICTLGDCPRVDTLAGSLRDAVGVLERTKGSFKSKELGELRKRLEASLASLG